MCMRERLDRGIAVGRGPISFESSGLLDKMTYKLIANDEKVSVTGRGKCKGCEKAMTLVLSIPYKHQLTEGWRAK